LTYKLANYLFGAKVLFIRDAKDNLSADYNKGGDLHKVIALPEAYEHSSNLLLSTLVPYKDILTHMIEIEMFSQELSKEEKKGFSHVKKLHEPYIGAYAAYRENPVGVIPGTNRMYFSLYKGTMMSASDVKKVAYEVDTDINRQYLYLMTVNEANQLRIEGIKGMPVVIDQASNSIVWIPEDLAALIKSSAIHKDVVNTIKPCFGFFALPTVKTGGKKSMGKAWFVSTLFALIERYNPDAPVLNLIREKSGFTKDKIAKSPTDVGNLLFSRSRSSFKKGYASMKSLVITFPPAGIRSILKHNSVGFPDTEMFSTDYDLAKAKRKKRIELVQEKKTEKVFDDYADQSEDSDQASVEDDLPLGFQVSHRKDETHDPDKGADDAREHNQLPDDET